MKYLRGPIIALVAFVIGVAVSPIRFYWESIACGFSSSSTGFRSSYLIQVSFSHRKYDSTADADEAFDQRLRKASKVLDLGPKLDQHGNSVGRRAVVTVFRPEVNQYFANIFWTDGQYLHSIYSSSYLHVSEFEKQHADE